MIGQDQTVVGIDDYARSLAALRVSRLGPNVDHAWPDHLGKQPKCRFELTQLQGMQILTGHLHFGTLLARFAEPTTAGVFNVVAGVTIVAAAATITARNPVYSAVWFGLFPKGCSPAT